MEAHFSDYPVKRLDFALIFQRQRGRQLVSGGSYRRAENCNV